MSQRSFEVHRSTTASVEAVWALLADSRSWPRWTPVDTVEVLSSPETPTGVGEVRLVHNGRYRVREQIVAKHRPDALSYTVLAGLAVRDYRADVRLEQTGSGTDVHWATVFRPRVPGTGWLYRRALLAATESFATGLAAEAERR